MPAPDATDPEFTMQAIEPIERPVAKVAVGTQYADQMRWLNNPRGPVRIEIRTVPAKGTLSPDGTTTWATVGNPSSEQYHTGDHFTIEVRDYGPAPVYVHLFDIPADDSISLIYPSAVDDRPSSCLVPNNDRWTALRTAGTAEKLAVFQIVPPFGSEVIKLIATEQFVDFSNIRGDGPVTFDGNALHERLGSEIDRTGPTQRREHGSTSLSSSGKWGTATLRFIASDVKVAAPSPQQPTPASYRGTPGISPQIIDSDTRDHFVRRKDYALIFGSNVYANWPRLDNPIHDAEAIGSVVKSKYGFETNVVENATRQDVKNVVRQYQEMNYGDYDQLFVYFAGHGAFDATYTDQGYVVTSDSPSDPNHYDECLSFNDLQEMLDKIPCKHIFLVLDTCYGGTYDPALRHAMTGESILRTADDETDPGIEISPGAKNDALPVPDSVDSSNNLDYLAALMGDKTRLFLSSGKKEPVPDGTAGEGSPFAQEFLDALREGDRQRILLFADIKRYVFLASPRPHASEFDDNIYGGDFVFVAH